MDLAKAEFARSALEVRPARTSAAAQRKVAQLKLNCPAPGNWDAQHTDDFLAMLRSHAADPDVGAILLQGKRLFRDKPTRTAGQAAADLDRIYAAVAGFKVPVFALVSGECSGTGLELAIACAGRIAAPGTVFRDLIESRGRLPTPATLSRLGEVIDVQRAATLVVLGESWSVNEAVSAGLVDVVTSKNPVAAAEALLSAGQLRERMSAERSDAIETQLYVTRVNVRRDLPNRDGPLMRLRALEHAVQPFSGRKPQDTQQLHIAYEGSTEAAALAYAAYSEMALKRQPQGRDVVSELRWALLREAVHLLDEGATPAQIDRNLKEFGFHESPFAQSDRAGMENVFTRHGVLAGGDDWFTYSPTLDLMADAGRLGGDHPGWCRYGADGRIWDDPDVEALLHASANFQMLIRKQVPDDQIVSRCLHAAINATSDLLERSQDASAESLDAIWVAELGFPRWLGGPLFWARQQGDAVIKTLEANARNRNTAGTPSRLLRRLVSRP
ncbi:MAG TPA: 3-hydroxyacyl-CoA dehydrogenase family protein [Hyphomonadaceae bacterium]|nr:3-hydroxyacyl-CoA dehydrogenase family protein [Hyphomonadaceae bacterium]